MEIDNSETETVAENIQEIQQWVVVV